MSDNDEARSTKNKPQPSYNMDRFLATSTQESPYVAGSGVHDRNRALLADIDNALHRLQGRL
jgi:hypothetical protein